MSRLITIISILVSIILLSLIGIFYAGQTKDQLDSFVETATLQCVAKDRVGLEKTTKKMSAFYESRHDFLSFYVKHNDIESIDSNLVSLFEYAKLSAFDSAQLCLAQIKLSSERIYLKELPNIANLF